VEELSVLPRRTMLDSKGKKLSVGEIARRLRANYLIEGTFRRHGERCRVDAAVIQTWDDAQWRAQWERPMAELFDLQAEVAEGVLAYEKVREIERRVPEVLELVGLQVALGPGPAGGVDDRLLELLALQPSVQRPDVRGVVRGDGDNERVWRVSVTAVRDEALLRALHRSPTDHGDLRVAVVHDVSAERRLARMKDDMLAVVSHELRTPLTPIKASAQMLRRGWERLDPAAREDLLATVERRSDHLTRLVEDLLLVGQLSSDRPGSGPRINAVPTDLAAVVRDDAAQLALSHPDHHLVVDAPETLPAVTDRMRVRQVLANLLDNACKFSQPGTTVEVTLVLDGAEAVVVGADQGRCIPAEDL
jgi:signal transduction histidine kinase